MKEEILWKLIHWDMQLLRDGWFGKPVYRVKLKYGTYREGLAEVKWKDKKFKTLKEAFVYLEKAMSEAEKVKL